MFLAIAPISGCVAPGALDTDLHPDFRLRGKIGVRNGPNEGGFSASFDWVQAGDRYAIELWGPFGQGRTRVSGDGHAVTVTDAYGATLTGVAPEALMRQQFGWSAPVDVLRHWVRGRTAPGQPATGQDRDAHGNLERFEQRGWTVELSRWRARESGPLPGKIVAVRQGRRITVICREWSFVQTP